MVIPDNIVTKLWLDDVRPAPEGWLWARTNEQAVVMLEENWPVEECSLDHDLGFHDVVLPEDPDDLAEVLFLRGQSEETGYDLVKWMIKNRMVPKKVRIHSWNPAGAEKMLLLLRDAGHSVTVDPFSERELKNHG